MLFGMDGEERANERFLGFFFMISNGKVGWKVRSGHGRIYTCIYVYIFLLTIWGGRSLRLFTGGYISHPSDWRLFFGYGL